MEDSNAFPVPESPSNENDEEKQAGKRAFIIIAIFILLIGVAAVSYIFGKKSNQTTSHTPTPGLALNETFIPEETSVPTLSPLATGSVSPTKKPSSTPTQTPTPTPNIKTKVLSATATLDGFRSSNGAGNKEAEIRMGRNIYLTMRGFVSFDITEIPSGVTIKEATLRLYQQKTIGNPYGVGGSLKIDHLNYGDSLDDSDYSMAALTSSFTTLTDNSVAEWKDANILSELKDDIANARPRSQYRIHFTSENTGGDATGDFAYFESAENTLLTGNTPQLVVKYY